MSTSTNTPIVIAIFAIYIFIGIMFGLIGMGLQSTQVGTPAQPTLLGFLSEIGSFFGGIFFTIGNLPLWANTLIFLPGIIGLVYIWFSFIRGSS